MSDVIGRSRLVRDVMDPARAAALHAALAMDGPPPGADDPLPPFFHHIYFWEPAPPKRLGADGHPALGDFIPDLGLPRRVWAGGRLGILHPLRAGEAAERQSRITAVTEKLGRSGPLAFVTIQHEVRQGGRLCVLEQQELAYKTAAGEAEGEPAPVPAPPDREPQALAFDATLLFRYSALAFNAHRIHYDSPYAREVEGYAAPVVQGPLLAQLLMLRAEAVAPLRTFGYRSLRPLTLAQAAVSNLRGKQLWVRDGDGFLVGRAVAGW